MRICETIVRQLHAKPHKAPPFSFVSAVGRALIPGFPTVDAEQSSLLEDPWGIAR